jgi:tyrosine-protein kinase Etk/Wzc
MPTADESRARLLSRALIAWRRRSLILGLWVTSVVTTLVVSTMMPKVYESNATLVVPRESSADRLLGGLGAAMTFQQIPGVGIPSLTPNRDLLLSLLRSRTMAQEVVKRFSLQERYRARYLADAIKQLGAATTISTSRENVISVKVEDWDPKTAAEMANFYVEQLDHLVVRYSMNEASRNRMFLTEQIARAKSDLEIAEAALRQFQERNRAIALQDQTKGAIEAAAKLKGEVMAAEVQLEVMRTYATDTNPDVISLRRRIGEMKRRLAELQYGDGASGNSRDFAVPLPKVPELGIELIRLTRDVKVGETLVALLAQQLEQTKIAEAKDLPVVQVLDRAVPAERHSRPKRLLNVMIASVASLFAGVFLAFLLENRGPVRSGS